MSDIAIKVENLGKSYLVGHNAAQSERYTALRDVITHNAKNLARKTRDMLAGRPIVQGDEVEEFWALKDVSFEIKQGDRVGIIGRNGAGKSTLLKILSRITEPTRGRIQINGRVASLLEVGTGFHPELSGRENIFLNGAILGMSRKEIQRKFDEIVDFAEVERFLDTPVKRYSSGMYVRLAFAVAAHLEPEILVVDEVLAVGDAQFQRKCLGKMEDVASEGRTVLFVSHNLDAVEALCTNAVLLTSGTVALVDSTERVLTTYLDGIRQSQSITSGEWINTLSGPGVRRVAVKVNHQTVNTITCGYPFVVEVEIEVDPSCANLELGVGLRDSEGRDILRFNNKHLRQPLTWPTSGTATIRIEFPRLNWIGGDYVLLGIYFGYVNGLYYENPEIMTINLDKQFPTTSSKNIVGGVNKIFIDGVQFK